MSDWDSRIESDILSENYAAVISFYEEQIEMQPDCQNLYWHLGIAHLLSEDEESAQAIWLMGVALTPESLLDRCTQELTQLLNNEAARQLKKSNKTKCWLIRSHLRSINPYDLSNILDLLILEIEIETFNFDNIDNYNVISLLNETDFDPTLGEKIVKVAQLLLKKPEPEAIKFVTACVRTIKPAEIWVDPLIESATTVGYQQNNTFYSIELIQLCLEIKPDCMEALKHLVLLSLDAGQYKLSIQTALNFYGHCTTTEAQFFGNALLLQSMLKAGAWGNISPVSNRHKILLSNLINEQPMLGLSDIKALIVYTGYLFYLQDDIVENRWFQNEISKLFYNNIFTNTDIKLPLCHSYRPHNQKKLKIGYIAHTLTSHSVGWLSRWLFQNHDRESFHISIYQFEREPEDPFFKEWFLPKVDFAHFSKNDIPAIAERIRDDHIDILVDLDSLTLDHTATVMSLKPAPVQATWLGWDASGIPTIDYYIADPYVLPTEADQHYSEKIFRLPQTYIAVKGFEIDVPTLRRRDLEIPGDGIVYYSSQAGMKRHPDTIQLQLQILKQVPRSYFLIKGVADQSVIQEMFCDLATDIGVDPKRLKFLPMASTEMIHRANMGIADVVLDTFPYNGATTTLETLWACIPLVTRVGTQFAARNSYAFLMNAGVTEGISWTADEYIEWGVRFGTDDQLRFDVEWKLKQSRKTSPLWDTKRFALEMEAAYRQMWQNYLES